MMRKCVFALGIIFLFSGINPVQASLSVEIKQMDHHEKKLDENKAQKALDEFKSLSKDEKKSRIKDVKSAIKKYKQDKKSGMDADTDQLLLVILAILLPPLAVYLYEGEINNRFWIGLILTLLGWLPGVIYALVLILGNY